MKNLALHLAKVKGGTDRSQLALAAMYGQEGHICLAGDLNGPGSYSPVKHNSLHDTWSATTRVDWYEG